MEGNALGGRRRGCCNFARCFETCDVLMVNILGPGLFPPNISICSAVLIRVRVNSSHTIDSALRLVQTNVAGIESKSQSERCG